MHDLQPETVKNVFESEPHWYYHISGKQAIYSGLTQFYQSRLCNAEKKFGEEIVRLEYAKMLFSAGFKRANFNLCKCQDWLKKTEKALADSKKDNDKIYHDPVPDVKSLTAVSKADVAKATPLPDKFGSSSAKDLFESLCPLKRTLPAHYICALIDVILGSVFLIFVILLSLVIHCLTY